MMIIKTWSVGMALFHWQLMMLDLLKLNRYHGEAAGVRIMELSYQGTFVPGNESSIGGTFVPGNESSLVRKFQLPGVRLGCPAPIRL